MADPKKMSTEEILAACRQSDGEGGAPADTPAEASAPETPAAAAETPPPAPVDRSKMSVEEMLAAARASAQGGAAPAADTGDADEAEEPAEAAAAPVDRSKMSVEEMLAAARASAKGGAAAPQAKPKAGGAKPKAKPAAKKAAAPAAASGPKDTASILAAARKSAKPGPISKAEAKSREAGKPSTKTKLTVPPMPEKPGYAQRPVAEAAAPGEDRRGFIGSVMAAFLGSSMAVGFSSLAVTHILWTLGLARFMFPNILTEPPTRFKVGFPTDYALGQVETKFKAQFGVWIARYEYEGVQQIYALKSVCTHLGCTPNWLEGEQKFKCPCHGSGFYKDGINFEGPAPRPLERYAISLADDGQLEVDKSRKFNEELGQWADPASFVLI